MNINNFTYLVFSNNKLIYKIHSSEPGQSPNFDPDS